MSQEYTVPWDISLGTHTIPAMVWDLNPISHTIPYLSDHYLHLACQNCLYETVHTLLDFGADPRLEDDEDPTPLSVIQSVIQAA